MKLWSVRYAAPLPGGVVSVREEDFYLPTQNDVRHALRAKGLFPIRIRERKPALLEWMDVRSSAWQLQLLKALRFQSTSASTGTALLNIIEAETDPRKRLAFLPTRSVLKAGGSFSEALKQLKLLDAATLAIIIAGERAGDLKGVVAQAIQHVEEKGKQMKVMMAALGWLSFDIISIISTIWGAQFTFIPYLKSSANKSTKDKVAAAKFESALQIVTIINYSLMIFTIGGSVGLTLLAMSFWKNRHNPEHFASRMIGKLPIISPYLRDNNMHDAARLMARLLRGGVPLDEAIRIIKDSSIEPITRRYWQACLDRLMAGVDTNKALARDPMTRAEQDQLRSIQSVDQLAEVFDSIAEERKSAAKTGQRKIMMAGMMFMMGLFGAVVLTMIWLLMIQNQGFMDSLKDMHGGG
ncbi:MAG TPA: type II secretion system F family protein [Alphaproteobacteria bacterium]|nr:type II secretion system F family protein [Alphaproteobacteria bacterium]